MQNIFLPLVLVPFLAASIAAPVSATTKGADWTFTVKFTPKEVSCGFDGNEDRDYHEGSLGLSCDLPDSVPASYLPGSFKLRESERAPQVKFRNVPSGEDPFMDIFYMVDIINWDAQYMLRDVLPSTFSDFTLEELQALQRDFGSRLGMFCDNAGCAAWPSYGYGSNFGISDPISLAEPLAEKLLSALSIDYGRPITEFRSPSENFSSPRFAGGSPVPSLPSKYTFLGSALGALIGSRDTVGGPDGSFRANLETYQYSRAGYRELGRVDWTVEKNGVLVSPIPLPPSFVALVAALVGLRTASRRRRVD